MKIFKGFSYQPESVFPFPPAGVCRHCDDGNRDNDQHRVLLHGAQQHGNERWLVVGTTREARGEYIVSKTLMEQEK
jgi:hypothetical protein